MRATMEIGTPAVVEPAVVEPAVVEPAVVEPAVVEPAGTFDVGLYNRASLASAAGGVMDVEVFGRRNSDWEWEWEVGAASDSGRRFLDGRSDSLPLVGVTALVAFAAAARLAGVRAFIDHAS